MNSCDESFVVPPDAEFRYDVPRDANDEKDDRDWIPGGIRITSLDYRYDIPDQSDPKRKRGDDHMDLQPLAG
ncbi:MAG: hypothetical protein NTW28_12755 [Candidatus Solibacter sp.]|nr:hypothetical protein [Candidatus Solibacter sp.]